MSTNLSVEQTNLRELVKRAAAKERRILSLSIVFTVLVISIGSVWIYYSANKVIKLQAQGGILQSKNEDLRSEIIKKQELLHQVDAELENARSTLVNIAQGRGDAKQQAKTTLVGVSNVQKYVREAINQTSKTGAITVPTPIPMSFVVPDVRGLNFDKADQTVRKAGFSVRKVEQEGPGAQGMVVSQTPAPGTKVPVNTQVSLYVIRSSNAPPQVMVRVPSLVGLNFEQAVKVALRVRLILKKVDREGPGAQGMVVSQTPMEGAVVPPGSLVSVIVISKKNQ